MAKNLKYPYLPTDTLPELVMKNKLNIESDSGSEIKTFTSQSSTIDAIAYAEWFLNNSNGEFLFEGDLIVKDNGKNVINTRALFTSTEIIYDFDGEIFKYKTKIGSNNMELTSTDYVYMEDMPIIVVESKINKI